MKQTIGVVLFADFELLDMFGPLEMFGAAPEHFDIRLVSENGGNVTSRQGPQSVVDHSFGDAPHLDILLVPGGQGTRREVDNEVMMSWLKRSAGRKNGVIPHLIILDRSDRQPPLPVLMQFEPQLTCNASERENSK
jgi:putative intracellular protease/amidase